MKTATSGRILSRKAIIIVILQNLIKEYYANHELTVIGKPITLFTSDNRRMTSF